MMKSKLHLAVALISTALTAPAMADLVVNAGNLGTLSTGKTLLSGTTLGKPNNAQVYSTVNNTTTTAWDRGEDVYQFTLAKPAYLYMTHITEPEPAVEGFGTPDHDYFLLNSLTTFASDNTGAYYAAANPKKQEATSIGFVQSSVDDTSAGSAATTGVFRSAGPTAANPNNPVNPNGIYGPGTYYISVDNRGAASAFQREGAYSGEFNVQYIDEVKAPNARPTRPVTNDDVNAPTKSITGTFGVGQTRWFQFNYTGQKITVDTQGTVIGEDNVDTQLALYNSDGLVVSFNDDVGQNSTDPDSSPLPYAWSRINIAAGSIPNGKYYLGFVEYKSEANPGFALNKYASSGTPVTGVSANYVINGLGGYLPGDSDLDDDVDFTDLLALAKHYGVTTGATFATGDFDTDDDVDFADLLALAKNYGQTYTGPLNLSGTSLAFQSDWALAQSLVPEPTTLSLLGGAGLAFGRRRRLSIAKR